MIVVNEPLCEGIFGSKGILARSATVNLFYDILESLESMGTESLKPFILPQIQIQESQAFLTLVQWERQYFDQLEAKSNQQALC